MLKTERLKQLERKALVNQTRSFTVICIRSSNACSTRHDNDRDMNSVMEYKISEVLQARRFKSSVHLVSGRLFGKDEQEIDTER